MLLFEDIDILRMLALASAVSEEAICLPMQEHSRTCYRVISVALPALQQFLEFFGFGWGFGFEKGQNFCELQLSPFPTKQSTKTPR